MIHSDTKTMEGDRAPPPGYDSEVPPQLQQQQPMTTVYSNVSVSPQHQHQHQQHQQQQQQRQTYTPPPAPSFPEPSYGTQLDPHYLSQGYATGSSSYGTSQQVLTPPIPAVLPNPHPDKDITNQQPQAMAPMVVQPGGNAVNMKGVMYDPGRPWSNGLCQCCQQPGTCMKSWCCPCVSYAQNKRRLEFLDRQGAYDPEHGGEFFSSDCWLHAFLTGCFNAGWVLQISTRNAIRSRYRIRGDPFMDCCEVFWCNSCSLTQESRELEQEETGLGWVRVRQT